jgi:SAM-dependent methyltransferase
MLGLARLIGHRNARHRPPKVTMLTQAEGSRKRDEACVAPEVKAETQGWYWLQHELVRERVNRMISGDRRVDVYGRFGEFLAENGVETPLQACVSLGWGSGGLERDLLARRLIADIDAYDLSADAITEPPRQSEPHGPGSIRYHAAGWDGFSLPEGQSDAAFASSSVHRVHALEMLFDTIRKALKPDGIFHLNEFVGPTRFQWTDDQLRLTNAYLDTLPERLRQTPAGRKSAVERPSIEQMLATDPTSALRSAEIKGVLSQYFEIVEERPYGGTLLHIGLFGIAQNFAMDNSEDIQHLKRFFDLEDRAIGDGVIGNDFAVLTAQPVVRGRRAKRGACFTTQLRPSPEFAFPGVDLTISNADNMRQSTDDHYLSVGRSAISAIERSLGGGVPRAILDLPCGFGRVTRFLRARYPDAAITVSDLDGSGVAFSAEQFSGRPAISVRDFRDLDLGETYDLIWVGSLITHLPAEQTGWFFGAMARHLTPCGRLVASLHGPSIIPRLLEIGYGLTPGRAQEVVSQFERIGFGYHDYYDSGHLYGAAITNDHYGISLTNESWVRAQLLQHGLELVAYETRSWDDHHDVLVARLPPTR